MIGTEFFKGQGFGNQLFCFITAKSIAKDRGFEFATVGQEFFGAPRWNQKGPYFMDVDLGFSATRDSFSSIYSEKSVRYFTNRCVHDKTHGCDISLFDPKILDITDGTLVNGNLQSEKYFIHNKNDIKKWLKVKPEYDSYDFHKEDLCILNIRGGEYVGVKELFLNRDYWINGMQNMKKINPNMEFIIITDDVKAANDLLPDVKANHFDIAKDYVSIKNAKYLLLSNSSFAYFPAFTSETVQYIIAPKYWARYNISNGYWATGQNIYKNWNYQDRSGNIFTSEECEKEFTNYQKLSKIYERKTFPKSIMFCRKIGLAKKILKKLLANKSRTI